MMVAIKRSLLLLAGLLLVGCGPLSGSGTPAGTAHVAVGARAPDFQAVDLDGQRVQLAAWRGHPVWINFWATWCPPCKAEMPLMEQKYQQYRAQGLILVGINLQESPATVRAWTAGKFHWSFVIDTDGKLANLLNLEGVPSHLFIDRAGVVQRIQVGDLTAAEMDACLAQIVQP